MGSQGHTWPRGATSSRALLITGRKEPDRHVGGGSEAMLTQRSESHVHHFHDGVINLLADDGSCPQCRGVEGYLHPDLAHVQAMRLKVTTVVVGIRPS
jgi:hypothetical protein